MIFRNKGKRLSPKRGRGHVFRLAVAVLCAGSAALFSSSGFSAPEELPPRPGPSRPVPSWSQPVKTTQTKDYVLPIGQLVLRQPYDYSQPVPERAPVDNSYFSDAVFVGDSLTDGLLIYSGITGATNLAYKGMTVESAQTKAVQFTGRSDRVTALEALGEKAYGKVYVMLGVNELGWDELQRYRDGYDSLLTEIQRLQPDALVYVQATLPVAESAGKQRAYLNNDTIRTYNEVTRQLAGEHHAYFLEVGRSVEDENGALPEEAGTDGIHLTRAYYKKWADYLRSHTVEE